MPVYLALVGGLRLFLPQQMKTLQQYSPSAALQVEVVVEVVTAVEAAAAAAAAAAADVGVLHQLQLPPFLVAAWVARAAEEPAPLYCNPEHPLNRLLVEGTANPVVSPGLESDPSQMMKQD